METLIKYWAEISLIIMILDKIVAKTPVKWDDLIITAIKETFKTIIPKK